MMRKWINLTAVAALAVVLLAAPLQAAPTPTPAPKPTGSAGQGLEISPPVLELTANPGETVTATIRVRNVTQGELIAKGKADDFAAGTSEDGQPKLLIDETGATRYSLKYWVQGVPDLRLAPQELKANTIKIAVPKNAEPGGHFGVVRFTAVPPDLEGTGVALSASVGTLILLKVGGTITEKVTLAQYATMKPVEDAKQSKTGEEKQPDILTSFFEHGPIGFLVRLRNEGSVHEKVTGTITIKNTFGKQVAVLKVNELGGNVLPDSVRRFEQTWDQKRLFGYYSAALAMTYSNGQTVSGNLGFWVIPWKLLLLVLVGLLVLGMLLRLVIRKYNSYIISQSRKRR